MCIFVIIYFPIFFAELMSTYCTLLINGSADAFDRAVAAKALCAILTAMSLHFDIYGTYLIPSLGKLFENIEYVFLFLEKC